MTWSVAVSMWGHDTLLNSDDIALASSLSFQDGSAGGGGGVRRDTRVNVSSPLRGRFGAGAVSPDRLTIALPSVHGQNRDDLIRHGIACDLAQPLCRQRRAESQINGWQTDLPPELAVVVDLETEAA